MPHIQRFAVRTSGRVLSDVRRPDRARAAAKPEYDPAALTKAELVEIAEAKGVDTDGTKAEIAERLNG